MDVKTVLIADDDARLSAALAIRLRAHGYDTVIAPDAYQAVAVATQRRPDVLLLDINMPAGSGLSVPDRICGALGVASIPVVFMTGESSGSIAAFTRQSSVSTGDASVLRKPFDHAELLVALDEALRASRDGEERCSPKEYII